MKIKVRCTHCKREQVMITEDPGKARRSCVFCGKSFKVSGNIIGEV